MHEYAVVFENVSLSLHSKEILRPCIVASIVLPVARGHALF
jgi:hypothetical protein